MQVFRTLFFSALLSLCMNAALAQNAPLQNPAALRTLAEQFLLAQAANMPGVPTVQVSEPDPRLKLAACDMPQAFLLASAPAFGKTTVGIRCGAPVAWTIYLPARIGATVSYVSSALPFSQGQKLGMADLVMKKGDLASLPAGVLTDVAQAIGRTVNLPLSAGMPLTRSALRSQPVVQQGQSVRVIATGVGFSISSEGRALTMGHEGDVVQVKTASGQLIAGLAQPDGSLAVRY